MARPAAGLAASAVGAAQASAVFAVSAMLVLALLALVAAVAVMRRRGVLHLPAGPAGSPERHAGKAVPLLPISMPDALAPCLGQQTRGGGGESPAVPASPCALPCGRGHGGGSKRPTARAFAHACQGALAAEGLSGSPERGKPPLPKEPFAHLDRSRYPWLPPPLQQRAAF